MDALYDYEPNGLIRDDAGHIIEKKFARLAYMQARAQLVTDDPLDDLRAKAEAEHMAKWVERERAKGRSESELTWEIRTFSLLLLPRNTGPFDPGLQRVVKRRTPGFNRCRKP